MALIVCASSGSSVVSNAFPVPARAVPAKVERHLPFDLLGRTALIIIVEVEPHLTDRETRIQKDIDIASHRGAVEWLRIGTIGRRAHHECVRAAGARAVHVAGPRTAPELHAVADFASTDVHEVVTTRSERAVGIAGRRFDHVIARLAGAGIGGAIATRRHGTVRVAGRGLSGIVAHLPRADVDRTIAAHDRGTVRVTRRRLATDVAVLAGTDALKVPSPHCATVQSGSHVADSPASSHCSPAETFRSPVATDHRGAVGVARRGLSEHHRTLPRRSC